MRIKISQSFDSNIISINNAIEAVKLLAAYAEMQSSKQTEPLCPRLQKPIAPSQGKIERSKINDGMLR